MNSGVGEEEEANLTRNVQYAKGFIALSSQIIKKVGVWNNATALTLSHNYLLKQLCIEAVQDKFLQMILHYTVCCVLK